MSDAVFRSFVLRSPDIWKSIVEFVKGSAARAIERGKPLHVFVIDGDMDRLDIQVSFYWTAVIPRIAEEVPGDDGLFHPGPYWHEKLALEFLGMEDHVTKGGALVRNRRSIARGKITVSEMAKYTTRVQAWAAQTHGVEWD
jgi:hypothetical protein